MQDQNRGNDKVFAFSCLLLQPCSKCEWVWNGNFVRLTQFTQIVIAVYIDMSND